MILGANIGFPKATGILFFTVCNESADETREGEITSPPFPVLKC